MTFPRVLVTGIIATCFLFSNQSFAQFEENPVNPKQTDAEFETDSKDQPSEAEQKTPEQKFEDELNEFERKIDKLERSGKYGTKAIEDFADELEQEYLTIADQQNLDFGEDYETLTPSQRRSYDRLNSISMALWYLEYIGPQLASDEDENRTLVSKIHSLLSKHSSAMRNRTLAKKFHDLSRRASMLNHQRFVSRYQNVFHFVRPQRSGQASADQNPAGDGPEDTSPIPSLGDSIRQLLRLRWEGKNLVLDREHWSVPFAGKSLREVDQQVRRALEDRGVELKFEDRGFEIRKKQLFELTPVILLFQNLQHHASRGMGSGSGSSSRSGNTNMRFSTTDLDASLTTRANGIDVFVRENSHPVHHILQLQWQDNGELRIRILGKNTFLFQQNADGQTRWIEIEEDAVVRSADSAAALYAEYPEAVDQQLLPMLNKFGIVPPLSRHDERVVDRVVEHLKGTSEETEREFRSLLEKMDSGSFGQRQNAFRKVSEDIDRFSILIEATPEDQFESAEAAARLKELRKKYSVRYKEIDAFIRHTGWLKNEAYLAGLMEHADDADKPIVKQHLNTP